MFYTKVGVPQHRLPNKNPILYTLQNLKPRPIDHNSTKPTACANQRQRRSLLEKGAHVFLAPQNPRFIESGVVGARFRHSLSNYRLCSPVSQFPDQHPLFRSRSTGRNFGLGLFQIGQITDKCWPFLIKWDESPQMISAFEKIQS